MHPQSDFDAELNRLREMERPDHVSDLLNSIHCTDDRQPISNLRDAIRLHRGQRLSEMLLASRDSAWLAAVLMLMGAWLVALALLGPIEPGMSHRISAEADHPL